jgi:hypothetical protein
MMRASALTTALLLAGFACAQTPAENSTPTASTLQTTGGQARVAGKVSVPFATLAGSSKNAVALANALRTGTPATLSYTATTPSGASTTTTTTITPPTKPMGWGNVSHALALAQFSLEQAGITNPTGAELQAALLGGAVTAADGSSVSMVGVLQQRASGLGWGEIAQSYGTTMGAINRGVKAQAFVAATVAPTTQTAPRTGGAEPQPGPSTGSVTDAGNAKSTITTAGGTAGGASHASKGITTAGGSSSAATHASKGLTTAGGNVAAGHGAKGLTTASGAQSAGGSSGVVSAGGSGHGNAYGRGIVTASGASANPAAAGIARGPSAGTVSANGAAASGIVTAQPEHGNGRGNPNGKGKGGG